ncbi:dihydrofolate synthase / folylpolyglutamate synthase [Lachnospiraceae bacterium NE2001]|nr:dihydrofolate synthase / folylpolyglutamate synthase [Lachnospiraceae bacterium NE2001]
MNYEEARNYIKEKDKLGSVFGLDSIHELLSRLDNPEQCAPAIHIAGTNGKGSILAFVEETFVKAGMTVGRYISPTIYNYRERYRLNKNWAKKEEIAEAITAVKEQADAMIEAGLPSPTAFEIETAVAFWLFRKWKCDVMLVECGMGGRLDATNVLENDVLNVMASISMDHMSVLGNTLAEITREKLGIVRDGSVLVTYPQCDEVMTEIMEYCVMHKVKLIQADKDELSINEESFHSASFTYRGEDYDISIGGEYQIYNAITAIEVLKYFKDVCEDFIYMGMLTTQWDGRFTVAHARPLIIVDGAHNEDAWVKLRESIDKYFTNDRIVYIMGVFRDKEYKKMIQILAPTMDKVYTVESNNPRSLPSAELAEELSRSGVDSESIGDVKLAIDRVLETEKTDTRIIICGTLSITGTALKYLMHNG